jgi:hypothetical protein
MRNILFAIFIIFVYGEIQSAPKRVELKLSNKALILSEKLVQSQIGLTEKNNRGSHIKAYGLEVFGKPIDGFYYCLAGQYWAINQACKQLNSINPLLKTAHCNTLFNWSLAKGVPTDNTLKIHDLVIWKYNNSASGHVERIDSVINQKLKIVKTYGFNTGSGTSNNGNGNFIRTRRLLNPIGRMFWRGSVGFNG